MKNKENNSKSSHPTSILIADDDPLVRESLREILTYRGYSCLEAGDGKEAISCLSENHVELLLLDLKLPRIDGMEVLKQGLDMYPDLPVIMISGHGTIQLAVEATKIGAYDFLEKPLEAERTLLTVRNALERSSLVHQRNQLIQQTRQRYQMIGSSPAMKKIFSLIEKAATSQAKVLIIGENGTGKELIARAVHNNNDRAAGNFVTVNCAAIPENLIESELFGHEKGAFTGAYSTHQGKFEQADKGTLFLDEVGDTSLMVQAKILRAVEEGIIQRVGGEKSIAVDIRIIAATNKDLHQEMQQGNFREDLFYRLNVITIYVPPLRDRREDIDELSYYFLHQFCEANGIAQKTLHRKGLATLLHYDWPGNVRQLRNVIERLVVLSENRIITATETDEALQKIVPNPQEPIYTTLRDAREQFEREFILKTLLSHHWKIQPAADTLGIERTHLWKKMKRYGIKKG